MKRYKTNPKAKRTENSDGFGLKYYGLNGWIGLFYIHMIHNLLMQTFIFWNAEILTFISFTSIISAVLIVVTLILIGYKKEAGKKYAIVTMFFIALQGLIYYVMVYNSQSSTDVTKPALDAAQKFATGNIIIPIIWAPYVLLSKRVKITLRG